ncbi:MAG: preprotein translocase subunit SecG [Flavobacteriia bacterium]|jgi:preprotein translocase subunit SecG|nr:preprotein translocase subunit SecG [Flavobacteriia bacterium]
MITTILSIIVSLAAILLIAVVFIQNPKGGGLSSDFGSPTQLGGVKQTTEFIDKLTWGLAATIVVSAIIMTMQQPKPQNQKKPNPSSQQAPAKGGQNPANGGK